ncbi:MAG: hypothetical protein COA69_07085 [Robiginitomaculum sp.]|nr:MAG: hypothetical protein COA69_07085 [Robiginitomaculum sp.]
MKLHNLRDFIAVARTGGIRAAARELNLSQPAISKSIAQLETELGTPLFERSARGSSLNMYGERFLDRAEAVMQELSRGKEEMLQLRGDTGGNVSISASSVISLAVLTKAISRFRKRFPDAHVNISEGSYSATLRRLRNRNLDFSVGPVPTAEIADDLFVEHLFNNDRCVIGRRGHPLQSATHLGELMSAEWITTSAVGPNDDEYREIFEGQGLAPPTSLIKCESLIALIALLAGTDALAFLPRQWATSELARSILAEIPITEKIPGPSTCLMRPNGLPLTPAAEALADAIRTVVKSGGIDNSY